MYKNKILELQRQINTQIDYESQYPRFKTAKDWLEEWDFKQYNINLYSHKIHDYPAMFIPQLARKIILEFSNEGDAVLDIFSGSGTTIVESKLLNRNAIGIDLNPLAILISKVKSTPIDLELIIHSYQDFWTTYSKLNDGQYKIKQFPNIDFWFDATVIDEFSKICHVFDQFQNKDIQDLYRIAFSSIIRKLSFCHHGGFKMHKDKNKEKISYTKQDIINSFHDSFCKVTKGVYEFSKIKNSAESIIIKGDSRSCQIGQQVDLILTSPPYGDSKTTVAYGQFSRLQSQWLGLISEKENGSIENIDQELLGGDIKSVSLDDPIIYKSQSLFQAISTFKQTLDMNDKKHLIRIKDVLSFYIDLNNTLANQSKYLKLNKYAIFVVASRTVKNIQLNTDTIIAELAREYGLELESIFYRMIPNKRMPHSVSATNIKGETCTTMLRESIVVLKKIKA